MLDCLHKFEVEEGDTFLIEGGIPHAIGAGCFLVELQEPTDYTIRTEKVTPNGLEVSDFMCHQGLGFDKMFDCFDYNGYTREEILRRYRILPNGENIVSYDNTEMFRLTKKDICGEHSEIPDGQFYGIYVLSGSGKIDSVPVCSGSQFFITSSCEQFKIEGDMTIMKLYGPKENV